MDSNLKRSSYPPLSSSSEAKVFIERPVNVSIWKATPTVPKIKAYKKNCSIQEKSCLLVFLITPGLPSQHREYLTMMNLS